MTNSKQNQNWRPFLYLLFFILLTAPFFWFFPDKLSASLRYSWDSLAQFLLILPAVILLFGIFSVMVTAEKIEKNFGKGTGFYGSLKALFFGSLASVGPFYLSFPIAKNLLDKRARTSAVIIFVCAWNGIGAIAEIIELHFMGVAFMLTRLILTAIFILAVGYAADYLTSKKNNF